MTSELLDCENLSVSRAGTTILENISLTIGHEETMLIQGPSGAGKTTLFHVLGLLEPYDSGTLTFDGTDVTQLSERKRAQIRREDIGVVFQDFRLIPDLTAWENARLPQRHAGTDDEHWIGTVFRRLDIDSLRDQYPATLSGGEKQRVAIARALANHPRLLLVDEPTGQLDAATSDRVMDLLFQVQEMTETSFLCISHDRGFESRFPTKYYLRGGRLQEKTDPQSEDPVSPQRES